MHPARAGRCRDATRGWLSRRAGHAATPRSAAARRVAARRGCARRTAPVCRAPLRDSPPPPRAPCATTPTHRAPAAPRAPSAPACRSRRRGLLSPRGQRAAVPRRRAARRRRPRPPWRAPGGTAARDHPRRPRSPATARQGAPCGSAFPRSAPAPPRARRNSTLARSSIIARTASTGSGSPTPDAWLRMRLSCSWRSWSGGMRTWASLPKPVLTPYITSPRLSAASTVRREAATPASAAFAMATAAPPRATATMSAMVRERPSRVMVGGMPKLTGPGCEAPSGTRLKDKSGQVDDPWPLLPTTGARGLLFAADDRPRHIRDRKVATELQVRGPGVGLEAPIEDQVIAADMGDAQRPEAHRLPRDDLEAAAIARHGFDHVPRISAIRCEADRREVGDRRRRVEPETGAGGLRHDP